MMRQSCISILMVSITFVLIFNLRVLARPHVPDFFEFCAAVIYDSGNSQLIGMVSVTWIQFLARKVGSGALYYEMTLVHFLQINVIHTLDNLDRLY